MNYKKLISPVIVALLIVINLSLSCDLSSQNDERQLKYKIQTAENSILFNETELERNRRLWTESKIKSYKITLESAIADALYTTLSPVEIEVREGRAISIRHLAKNEKPVSIEDAKNNYGLILYARRKIDTIEGLFDLIKRAEEGRPASDFKTIALEVEYDPKYHYPTKIKYDAGATDSYIFLQIKKFEITG